MIWRGVRDNVIAILIGDYKGEFRLGNRQYCYPLTITDFASRYLLACEALSLTQEAYAFAVFERAFKDSGLSLSGRSRFLARFVL